MKRMEYLQNVIESQKSPIEVFMGMQEDASSYFVVDVRIGDSAFLKEKIAGATEIPLNILADNLEFLKDKKMVFLTTWGPYCTLAKQASIILLNAGIPCLEIAGGNQGWKETGLPMAEVEGKS